MEDPESLDPSDVDLWLPTRLGAIGDMPAIGTEGRPILPGTTPQSELEGPYMRVLLRMDTASDLSYRVGELGLSHLNW